MISASRRLWTLSWLLPCIYLSFFTVLRWGLRPGFDFRRLHELFFLSIRFAHTGSKHLEESNSPLIRSFSLYVPSNAARLESNSSSRCQKINEKQNREQWLGGRLSHSSSALLSSIFIFREGQLSRAWAQDRVLPDWAIGFFLLSNHLAENLSNRLF